MTADGLRTAQFEHTILVTPSGAEVLTLSPRATPDIDRASSLAP